MLCRSAGGVIPLPGLIAWPRMPPSLGECHSKQVLEHRAVGLPVCRTGALSISAREIDLFAKRMTTPFANSFAHTGTLHKRHYAELANL